MVELSICLKRKIKNKEMTKININKINRRDVKEGLESFSVSMDSVNFLEIEETTELSQLFSKKLVNRILKDGKKGKAIALLNETKSLLKSQYQVDPDLVVLQAILNLSPTMKLLSVRKGAQTLKVPFPLSLDQQYSYGIRLLLSEVRNRKTKTTVFPKALAKELWEASQKKGSSKAYLRSKQLSKEAEQNRSNLYLRWF